VGAVAVVVVDVGLKDSFEAAAVEDQEPIEAVGFANSSASAPRPVGCQNSVRAEESIDLQAG
jgi:hypothetical protein